MAKTKFSRIKPVKYYGFDKKSENSLKCKKKLPASIISSKIEDNTTLFNE